MNTKLPNPDTRLPDPGFDAPLDDAAEYLLSVDTADLIAGCGTITEAVVKVLHETQLDYLRFDADDMHAAIAEHLTDAANDLQNLPALTDAQALLLTDITEMLGDNDLSWLADLEEDVDTDAMLLDMARCRCPVCRTDCSAQLLYTSSDEYVVCPGCNGATLASGLTDAPQDEAHVALLTMLTEARKHNDMVLRLLYRGV